MLLTTLPIDLLHDILLMLDDRRTLAACISTNRQLNEVFKAHPNSILREVVCNEIGIDVQVFPYAWKSMNEDQPAMSDVGTSLATNLSSGLEDPLTATLKFAHFTQLIESDITVREMAKTYSIRFKEGRILRNALTTQESRRFHIAAYLFSRYHAIWRHVQGFYEPNSEDTREERELKDNLTLSKCDGFLTSLSTKELFQLQEFQTFLLQDIKAVLEFQFGRFNLDYGSACAYRDETRGFTLDQWHHHLLSRSTEYFQRWDIALGESGEAPTHLERKGLWLTDSLARIMLQRGVTKSNEGAASTILDSKGVLINACQRCGQASQAPIRLFNDTNLEEVPDIWDYCLHLPQRLPSNPVETRRIRNRIHGNSVDTFLDAKNQKLVVIRDIMDHAKAQATLLLEKGQPRDGLVLSDDEGEDSTEMESDVAADHTPGTYKWSANDVLCQECFINNFRDLYYAWWLDERQTDRVEAHNFTEQCWWGYECRTQRGYDHASRLDHCCARTRGIIS